MPAAALKTEPLPVNPPPQVVDPLAVRLSREVFPVRSMVPPVPEREASVSTKPASVKLPPFSTSAEASAIRLPEPSTREPPWMVVAPL